MGQLKFMLKALGSCMICLQLLTIEERCIKVTIQAMSSVVTTGIIVMMPSYVMQVKEMERKKYCLPKERTCYSIDEKKRNNRNSCKLGGPHQTYYST